MPLPYSAALVTGAGQRIGRAIALALGSRGYKVAVHYHGSADAAQEVVDLIRADGGEAVALSADLINEGETKALLPAASKALGTPIDVVVNNASLFEKDEIATLSADNWNRHQRVNLLAPLLLMQAMANALPKGNKGSIINIIDQRVLKPNPQYLSYTQSKHGLWLATKTAAQDLAPAIRVNGIGPGPTLANIRQSAEEFKTEAAAVLLKQGPALSEITETVHFLLETPSLTGQMVALDGGQHLAWRTADILED